MFAQLGVVNSQDCKSFSYASYAVRTMNSSFTSNNNKINTFQEAIDIVQQSYLALVKEDRDFNSRMYISFSSGDMIAVVNCRSIVNNNLTSSLVLDNVYSTSCIKSKRLYVAAIVSSTVYTDTLIHVYDIDATGTIIASTQASQIFTSTQTYSSLLFAQSSSIITNSCGWINDNSSYVCKGINYVIAAEYYSTIEPCADQCLSTSHAVKIVDQMMYLKSTILSYNNIQTISQIYPLIALMIQYANVFDKAYTFVIVGFANDDFYGLRRCYLSDYPLHESCMAAGPSQRYVVQIRNSRIWNDNKRHAYMITDEISGTLVSLNHAEVNDYMTTQKTWYVQTSTNPTKLPIWSDPYIFGTEYGRTYGAALYDTNNVMSGVLGADQVSRVPCYETALRNNYAVTLVNNAVAFSVDKNDLMIPATSLTDVNKILSKLYELYTVSDKDDSISTMITQTNGDFYLIQDCYHYSQGNNSMCSISRDNRWIVHVSNNVVFGDQKLHFRFLIVKSTSTYEVSISDSDITASVSFNALQQPYYIQALNNGFGWSSYSSAQLGNSGYVYYGRIVSSNTRTITAVIASFTYIYQLNTRYDISNILTNKFLVNAPVQDKCITYSLGSKASVSIAADSAINEYLTFNRDYTFKPSQKQMINVLRSLYKVYVDEDNGFMSTLYVGLPNGDYFALVNCASTDNSNVDACAAIPSSSTSKIIYQIVNRNVTGTQFLYSYQMDLTSPINWNAFSTPIFTSSYPVNILNSVWYTYGASSANTISPYHYKYGSSDKDAVRSFVNPIKLKDGTLLGVVGAYKPNKEPCWNICRRNSATNYIVASIKQAVINSKLNIDTSDLGEALNILSVMAKAYISSAFHTTRFSFMGGLASKNSFSIRNCNNLVVLTSQCKAAGAGVVAVAEISSPLIYGNSLRRGFMITRFGDVINTTLSAVGPTFDPITRPWFQNAQASLVPGTGEYVDAFGRLAKMNYLPMFDSQGKFYGAVNSDIGYEESCSPKSMQPINSCTVMNGGCSLNADCIQSPFDNAVSCMCKLGFIGDGFVCMSIPTPTPTVPTGNNNSEISSSSNNNSYIGAIIGLAIACGVLLVLLAVQFKKIRSSSFNSSVPMEKL